jgi:ABC-type multidrug transport system permease subunit
MKILASLLLKDLCRAYRNPVGWGIFIAIPLVITALVGLVFGPRSSGAALGRIRFAVVDEDGSSLTRLLQGSAGQSEAQKHLDPVFLDRAEAERQLRDNKLSAMIVIPAQFTHSYLASTNLATLELVKNPAESINPAVLEELLGALVTAMDALKQHLGSELPAWQEVLNGTVDYRRVSELIVRAGDKLQAARKVLFPPQISYTKASLDGQEARTASSANHGPGADKLSSDPKRPGDKSSSEFNIFGYLLPGMAAMFLLFLGENASRDIHRETQQRTLQRFRTLHPQLFVFIASKVLFCLVFLLLGSAVMLGIGGLIFRIRWPAPLPLGLLTASYCAFASGLMVVLPALLGEQRTAQAFSSVVAMLLGMAGGSMMPIDQLPRLLRDYICPLLPTSWYIQAVRALGPATHSTAWLGPAIALSLAGFILMAIAAFLLRRRLEKGGA